MTTFANEMHHALANKQVYVKLTSAETLSGLLQHISVDTILITPHNGPPFYINTQHIIWVRLNES